MPDSTAAGGQRINIDPGEWEARVDLAACHRLVALYGMDDIVYTHISARVPGSHDHFLINRFGTMFEEITASTLVRIDIDGKPFLFQHGYRFGKVTFVTRLPLEKSMTVFAPGHLSASEVESVVRGDNPWMLD